MSFRSLKLSVLLVLAAAVPLAASSSAALAADPGCVEACIERWTAEREACDSRKEAVFANIAANEQACLAACPAGDYKCQGKCMHDAEVKRRAYHGTYMRCLAQANTVGWSCYRNCEVSRSRP